MPFNTLEISNQDGNLATLYLIRWGNDVWRYTSADRDLVDPDDDEIVWLSVAARDTGMTQGGSTNADMTIDIPANLPIVRLFRATPPAGKIELEVRRIHPEDGEAVLYWVGTVQNVKRLRGNASAQIIGRVITATVERLGLRLCWGRGCPHFLGDGECKVDLEDYAVTATLIQVDGDAIVVDDSGHGIDYFDGGFFRWQATDAGTYDQRGIEQTIFPNAFRVFGTTDRLEVGMEVKLYPGCNLTPETCDAKFDNLPNFGGDPYMTDRSIFDGDPVV